MLKTAGEFDERVDQWQRQAARFRSLSRLLGDREGSGPLAELARGIDEQIRNPDALRAGVIVQALRTEVLVTELDMLRARARAALNEEAGLRGSFFTTEDVREASRLCVEEAAAAYEFTQKRVVTEQAFALAQLAEEISRNKVTRGRE